MVPSTQIIDLLLFKHYALEHIAFHLMCKLKVKRLKSQIPILAPRMLHHWCNSSFVRFQLCRSIHWIRAKTLGRYSSPNFPHFYGHRRPCEQVQFIKNLAGMMSYWRRFNEGFEDLFISFLLERDKSMGEMLAGGPIGVSLIIGLIETST